MIPDNMITGDMIPRAENKAQELTLKDFFLELLEYGHHVNLLLIEKFLYLPGETSEKAITLFSHILNAHQIWNYRIEPAESPFETWQD
ncbi:MAG: hypothetical protein EOO04_31605, partial [Chitinophagaceae bacterium]